MTSIKSNPATSLKTHGLSTEDILHDYKLGWISRHVSLVGRKEVFLGRAKFGVFGDGKELAQMAMARVFEPGDHRSGYYRDQTFMFASGLLSFQQFFAQLYAHTDLAAEPASGGRLMNGHFSTRILDENGRWKDQTKLKNSSADVSPTGAQMPRLVGLAWASKLYRENPQLHGFREFSNHGNEVAFGTIGNASTSEGIFLNRSTPQPYCKSPWYCPSGTMDTAFRCQTNYIRPKSISPRSLKASVGRKVKKVCNCTK